MQTLRIAQIGSTKPIDFSAKNPLAFFQNANIEVDYFVDSFALINESKQIYHGSELESRHNATPYSALILCCEEFSGNMGNLSVGMYTLLQLTTNLSERYRIPIFYNTDFETKRIRSHQQQVELLKRKIEQLEDELERAEEINKALREQNQHLQMLKSSTEYSYEVISNAFFWKATKPFRVMADGCKKLAKKIPPLYYAGKGLRYWKRYGTKALIRKLKSRKLARKAGRDRPSKAELEKQRKTVFEKEVTFSILVPLYNTPLRFLKEMINSVTQQTYPHWELCLADGSDAEHAEVGEKVLALAKNDSRIKYLKLEKNLGISENTNACIDMATGNYIALFDHDDILHPSALYEMMKAICEQDADFVYTDEVTFESPNINKTITCHFKPDFAIDNLRANNYICHFSAFSREVLEKTGKFDSHFDGSQDHDMILRLTANAKHVVHIPKILYYWRSHPLSVAMDINSKKYAILAGQNAVKASVERANYQAKVESSRAFPTIYRVRYQIKEMRKVSIIIPNKDHLRDLKKCINSILTRTTYPNYEIVIVDNGSTDMRLFDYYEELTEQDNITVCSLDIPFNYSRLNNYAVTHATGDYYLLLNNDIEIITPNWIEEMMMYAQREDVGAVGAMLYYPDNTIQHAGIMLGLGAHKVAGHIFYKELRNSIGYMGRLCYAQNLSAVTAACMLVKSSAYHEVGGLDEGFEVAFNDVDFCLKLRQAGYVNVWTPYAEAYHYESKTRSYEDTPEKQARFERETERFKEKWNDVLKQGDPYCNPKILQ